jgi:hypothetical protein
VQIAKVRDTHGSRIMSFMSKSMTALQRYNLIRVIKIGLAIVLYTIVLLSIVAIVVLSIIVYLKAFIYYNNIGVLLR